MTNPFKYSSDNKRYHTLSYHNNLRFNEKLFKAVINGGFTCPNIDGKVGYGGCIYCTEGGSEFSSANTVSIEDQLLNEKERIYKKNPNCKIIAYFQSHTNTYKPVDELRKIYFSVLKYPFVKGISIATRSDCIDLEVLNLLTELSSRTYLTVELGLQTIFDETARLINRCHSYQCFLNTYKLLKENNIRVCVHIINGLPNETNEMMIETAKALGKLAPDGIKIHLLHIMKNTPLYEMYKNNKVQEMSFEDYIYVVCNQLAFLPPSTVVERITGDGSKDKLAAPLWSRDKIRVLGSIDKYLYDHNMYQGMYYK